MGGGQEKPWSLSVVTVGSQSLRVTLSTPALCWPGPSKSTRPTNSSLEQVEGKDRKQGQAHYRSSFWTAILTWNGRWRAPRRTFSTVHPPLLLLGACHTSSRKPFSTTTSAKKPDQGSLYGRVTLRPRPHAGGSWGRKACSTLGMTVKTVSHVEFTARTRGAQGRCESPGLRS